MEMAIAVGVGEASVDEIDLVNIRQATHLAMARAVRALPVAAHFALVDGNDAPALPCKCDTLVERRRAQRFHRRGLDHRQGDARPADGSGCMTNIPATIGAATRAMARPIIIRG